MRLFTILNVFTRRLNKEFWLSQIFIIASTVLGVYLAAHIGLKEAINYENIMDEETKYHIISSLCDELNDTVEYTDNIIKNLSNLYTHEKIEKPSFYIWDSMKYIPQTLELPSFIITTIRRYNHNITTTINRYSNKKIVKFVFKKEINKLNYDIKKFIPKMIKHKQKIEKFLIKKGVL